MPKSLAWGGPASVFLLLITLLAVAGPGETRAQALSAPADSVVSVSVTGNSTVDADLIRRAFALPVGGRYSTDAVRRGIRRLYDLGFFNDVVVEGERAEAGIAVTVRVSENPRVGQIEFSGNEHYKKDDLIDLLGPTLGRMADDRLLSQVQRRVGKAYERKGYSRATVTPRFLPGDSVARRVLFVEIAEGPRLRVEAVRFLGIDRLKPSALKGAMKQGTTGFLRKGILQPEVVAEDMKRIEARMATLGHRDGETLGYEIVPGSEDDHVVIEVTVEEGPRYYVGAVRWEGNEILPDPLLYAVTKLHSGKVFNQEDIDRTEEEVFGLYADQGYIYVSLRPDFAVSDSTVDVTFRLLEGEPSRVHDIVITGNTRTKERVIRRQLAIRPGDLFRRNALIRSQRELSQLGYFGDIGLDSRPVTGTNDIDLILNVEERQVGTASAGFGFSSAVGLTGFMELGHSNLFGNGQSLNLRMERGGQRNNAELSLTEPWFLGTPTSVGVDLFSTNRIYRGPDIDIEVRRAGGALRLGRPLPLAYTRIFATYRLENQTVVDETSSGAIDDATGEGSRSYVTGFRLNQDDQLTSSLSLALTRNSTDHPIYPTVGSQTTLRGEFNGGPLGGDQIFQKYELDLKHYSELFELGQWKPVLMLRARAGAVGDAFRSSPLKPRNLQIEDRIPEGAIADSILVAGGGRIYVPVPRAFFEYPPETNEFFRMGGTSYDALRGYDDFEIVPRDNVTQRFLVTESTTRTITVDSADTTGATADTTFTTDYTVSRGNVFYPGGRYMFAFTGEWQFPIADPLHGLLFTDIGGTWNDVTEFRWNSLHRSVGFGLRLEVPLLGLIGFDYGYGFDRLDRVTGRYDKRGWEPHIQFGRIF